MPELNKESESASQGDQFANDLQAFVDGKTKPVGSLGRIEALAVQLARLQQSLRPDTSACGLILFAGDHGMATAGVSAYPQAVTRQMLLNFLTGGAAANAFANALGVSMQIVDAGVVGEPVEHPALQSRRIRAGTRNAIEEPAMTDSEFAAALAAGREFGEAAQQPVVAFGEMGIGNTSAASLVAAKLSGTPVGPLTGRGTGHDDAGLATKRALLERAAARTAARLSAADALREYAGFEMVMIAGAMLGAAEARRLVLVDGFICTVAAFAALQIDPTIERALVFAHRSAEAGHGIVLEALHARPLLDLDLRLGEGTGAILAWPLVQAAGAMLRDMASFDSAGVDGPA
ncbi:MAG: nicotinate-nucleotide--dimethylbenzimidazole phosphoribosyltransferase [Pseudomonadota bacterium]